MAAHKPEKRAEATLRQYRPVTPTTVEGAREGSVSYVRGKGHIWNPVEGPHLRVVREKSARNKTGVVGISFGMQKIRRKDGTYRVRHYFFATFGRASRKFCVESMGQSEAFRRAVKLRATWELRIRQANAFILAARQAGGVA